MAFKFEVPDGLFVDEDKKWNALSQTLGQQIKQLGDIQQRAQQENAAHAESLRDLERVEGLKNKASLINALVIVELVVSSLNNASVVSTLRLSLLRTALLIASSLPNNQP